VVTGEIFTVLLPDMRVMRITATLCASRMEYKLLCCLTNNERCKLACVSMYSFTLSCYNFSSFIANTCYMFLDFFCALDHELLRILNSSVKY
jgi:hypothetical protein